MYNPGITIKSYFMSRTFRVFKCWILSPPGKIFFSKTKKNISKIFLKKFWKKFQNFFEKVFWKKYFKNFFSSPGNFLAASYHWQRVFMQNSIFSGGWDLILATQIRMSDIAVQNFRNIWQMEIYAIIMQAYFSRNLLQISPRVCQSCVASQNRHLCAWRIIYLYHMKQYTRYLI